MGRKHNVGNPLHEKQCLDHHFYHSDENAEKIFKSIEVKMEDLESLAKIRIECICGKIRTSVFMFAEIATQTQTRDIISSCWAKQIRRINFERKKSEKFKWVTFAAVTEKYMKDNHRKLWAPLYEDRNNIWIQKLVSNDFVFHESSYRLYMKNYEVLF